MADTLPKYMRNPDVVLREEDEDGALLFNPDTNQIKVINVTALFIWQLCDGTQNLPGLVAALQDAFDDVPQDEVAGQVKAFIEEMTAGGFVGTVED